MNDIHRFICEEYKRNDITIKEIAEKTGYAEKTIPSIASKNGAYRNSVFDMKEDEVFKTITMKGLEDYSISNYGKVINKNGQLLVSNKHHQSGYEQIRLVTKDGDRVSKLIHVLVANEFVDYEKGKTLDHKDRNRTNNYYKNLRYATSKEQSENQKERCSYTCLTEEDVHDICLKLQKGFSIAQIVKTNPSYTKSKVEKIRQRIRWGEYF